MRSIKSRWPDSVVRLAQAGFSTDDAYALRRIAMTLHRWHEMECGGSNDYYSFALVRGKKNGDQFEHDDAGMPFLERHENRSARGDGKYRTYWTAVPDRERGALKRLAAIMAKYPGFESFVQTDPRGCSLYILSPGLMASREPDWLESNYNQGIAVCK